jgi:hypothetical protein
MKKLVLAIMITASTMSSAMAWSWGDREQGALAGLFLGALVQKSLGQSQPNGYPPVQQGYPPVQQGYPQQYPTQQYPTQQFPVYSPQPQIIVQTPPLINLPQPMQRVCDTFPQIDIYGRFHGNRTVCRTIPY